MVWWKARGQAATLTVEWSSGQFKGQRFQKLRGYSSHEDLPTEADMEAENTMKRSQMFCSSFSFGEDQQPQSRKEDGEDEEWPNNNLGRPDAKFAAESMQLQQRDTNQPSRAGVFWPQELWLAMTKCLSLRWLPHLSDRQTDRKLAYKANLDQSQDAQSSDGSETTNGSSASVHVADKTDVDLVGNGREDVRSRVVKNGPPPGRGVSRSCSRLPESRRDSDMVLAPLCSEKDMFLRIELMDVRKESDDLSYRAEWKLSERTEELAEGVWLSRSQTLLDWPIRGLVAFRWVVVYAVFTIWSIRNW